MATAAFKDLCIDTTCGETLARFWAAALGMADPEGNEFCAFTEAAGEPST